MYVIRPYMRLQQWRFHPQAPFPNRLKHRRSPLPIQDVLVLLDPHSPLVFTNQRTAIPVAPSIHHPTFALLFAQRDAATSTNATPTLRINRLGHSRGSHGQATLAKIRKIRAEVDFPAV
jgi:hypothetical protein